MGRSIIEVGKLSIGLGGQQGRRINRRPKLRELKRSRRYNRASSLAGSSVSVNIRVGGKSGGLGEVRRSVGSSLAGGSVSLTVGGCSGDLVGHRGRWVT